MKQPDYKRIREILLMAPLCTGKLIEHDGDRARYCALGALARAGGMSQEKIADIQQRTSQTMQNRESLSAAEWEAERFRVFLERSAAADEIEFFVAEEYGLSLEAVHSIPDWNDDTPEETRVRSVLEGLTMRHPDSSISDDDDSEAPGEKAAQAGRDGGDTPDPTEAPAHAAAIGGRPWSESADSWPLGSGPLGHGLREAAQVAVSSAPALGQVPG